MRPRRKVQRAEVWVLIERVPGRSGWHEVIHAGQWADKAEAVREARWLAQATTPPVAVRQLREAVISTLNDTEVRPD